MSTDNRIRGRALQRRGGAVLNSECIKAVRPKVVYLYHYDQDYASRIANPKAEVQSAASIATRAASLETLRAALGTQPVELRMADWYPPMKAR